MIADNLNKIKSVLPEHVKLVAVSKTVSADRILEAYGTGQKIFGENKVQELTAKYNELPKDIKWHMIGHLQTNKVKFIVPFISLIHSVDSFKLLEIINKESERISIITNCLLQVHIAEEQTKFGFNESEIRQMLGSEAYKNLKNVRISGLMGMATFTDNVSKVRGEFHALSELFKTLKIDFFSHVEYFKELSMGMSSDYKIGIEEGSTMVRIGTDIFGSRNQNLAN